MKQRLLEAKDRQGRVPIETVIEKLAKAWNLTPLRSKMLRGGLSRIVRERSKSSG